MTLDCAAVGAAIEERLDDPRVSTDAIRCIPAAPGLGAVLLVGVVHDHPASMARVARLLERVTPDVLALELPALAMPLFRAYARDVYTPPRLGGEMSTALQAAGDVPSVGLDAPSWEYLRQLVGTLRAEPVDRRLAWRLASDVLGAIGHAVVCRLGAFVDRFTGLRLRLYTHLQYDTTLLDPPAVQAAHESAHLARQQSFLRAVQTPRAMALIDEAREAGMAARLHRIRARGDIVAVVGMEHLDGLERLLPDLAAGRSSLRDEQGS